MQGPPSTCPCSRPLSCPAGSGQNTPPFHPPPPSGPQARLPADGVSVRRALRTPSALWAPESSASAFTRPGVQLTGGRKADEGQDGRSLRAGAAQDHVPRGARGAG